MRYDTRVVHDGEEPCPSTGAMITPIYQTAVYVQERVGEPKGYEYSRMHTPTRSCLERKLASLEGGRACTAFSSGMAAIDALMHTLKKGDHVLACDDLYGGTKRLFTEVYIDVGLEFDFVDMLDPSVIEDHVRDNTRMIYLETPSNPMLKLADIGEAARVAGERDIHCVVDNTFMTPYFQLPLELGADTVIHSLSKYLSGHNDVIGGAVVTADEEMGVAMEYMVKTAGSTLPPFDSWLTLRGIKTLGLRMNRHDSNARRIAGFLEGHEDVSRVIYPGLGSHPQHDLAKEQTTGYGGMITIELAGGYEAGREMMEGVEVWYLAESLGGVESMVTHPASMTHRDVPEGEREALGITEGLVRLSVGIEDPDDLIEDLERALGS